MRGLNGHLSQARSCAWLRSRAIIPPNVGPFSQPEPAEAGAAPAGAIFFPSVTATQEAVSSAPEDDDEDTNEDLDQFQLLSIHSSSLAPTSRHDISLARMIGAQPRFLDDSPDETFVVHHAHGGHVVRIDDSLKKRWEKIIPHATPPSRSVPAPMNIDSVLPANSGSMPTTPEPARLPAEVFAPFISETDWAVAKWFVKSDIAQTTFNEFLKIPEVSIRLIFAKISC